VRVIRIAEVVTFVASVAGIIQLADRIIELCKFYTETARQAPSDLRAILIETSTIKTILENLQFLAIVNSNSISPSPKASLGGEDGPIQACLRAITQLEALFPSVSVPRDKYGSSKRAKTETIMKSLAWPFKESRAKKLRVEMSRYKPMINLALTTESVHDIKDIKNITTEIHTVLTGKSDLAKFPLCANLPSILSKQSTETSHMRHQSSWL
jgi:hypothetical protein